MNWNWKVDIRKNIFKICSHIFFEYTSLAAWYIALEGHNIFWPIGIATAFVIHLLIFTKIDFLHELHHHHKNQKSGHANHPQHGNGHKPGCKCDCFRSLPPNNLKTTKQ